MVFQDPTQLYDAIGGSRSDPVTIFSAIDQLVSGTKELDVVNG